MDMTLAEQLVWAAVFAQCEAELRAKQPNGDLEGRMLSAATTASFTVESLRSAYKFAARRDSVKQHMGQAAFMHLQQMTFKAED